MLNYRKYQCNLDIISNLRVCKFEEKMSLIMAKPILVTSVKQLNVVNMNIKLLKGIPLSSWNVFIKHSYLSKCRGNDFLYLTKHKSSLSGYNI